MGDSVEDTAETQQSRDANLKERMMLFPGLYEDKNIMAEQINQYAVEVPGKKHAVSPTNIVESNSRASFEAPPTMSTRQQPQIDIWGRIPFKDAPFTVDCKVCRRPVNTLRFAQHLDKCLGIGTMARSAASGAPTRSASTSSGK